MSVTGECRKAAKWIVWGMPNRYGHLVRAVRRNQCRTLLEIGVWNGDRSVAIIEAALKAGASPESIRYFGFDLFENADAGMVPREASKFPPTMEFVKKKLSVFEPMGVRINLYKGDTTETLPRELAGLPQMDFVFIDGGHSYETVKSDWECVQRLITKGSVVIFDDYVNEAGVAKTNVGVNKLVDGIDRNSYSVSLLNPVDSFRKPWGILRVRFARVTIT